MKLKGINAGTGMTLVLNRCRSVLKSVLTQLWWEPALAGSAEAIRKHWAKRKKWHDHCRVLTFTSTFGVATASVP
jgi:hypothetical protein